MAQPTSRQYVKLQSINLSSRRITRGRFARLAQSPAQSIAKYTQSRTLAPRVQTALSRLRSQSSALAQLRNVRSWRRDFLRSGDVAR